MPGDSKRKRETGLQEASPHYYGHRERLRTRFREAGSDAVSDYELLELVLFRTIPQRDLKPLAKDLIAKFGSFAEVLAAPAQRLEEVKGIKEATSTDLQIIHAVAGRLAKVSGGKSILLRERVARSHRMNEVVRRVDARERRVERLPPQAVARHDLGAFGNA